jgi:hypothetical protein
MVADTNLIDFLLLYGASDAERGEIRLRLDRMTREQWNETFKEAERRGYLEVQGQRRENLR